MLKTTYICQLPESIKREIAEELAKAGITDEMAMNGRLCDLEDTIDISKWLASSQNQ